MPNGKKIKDRKWWELNKCLSEFYKNHNDIAVQRNIEFLSKLRNLIVHRNLPELDATIFAECQANILNFNDYLNKYFGEKHTIDTFLSFSLQLFRNPKNFIEASKKELKSKNATEVVDFIKSFRSSLTTEILESPEYSFKAVLIQVKNHESNDALALRFINEKDLSDDQKENLKRIGIVLVKSKNVDGVPENYTLTYEELVKELRNTLPAFKQNKQFYQIKKEIIEKNPYLIYTRKLDPNNPRSPKKDFYDRKIIEIFKGKYK